MNAKTKTTFASWVLLAVYVPMLILSSLHFHHVEKTGEAVGVVCAQCVGHQHHAGHLLALTPHQHECVLCQIIHVPYLLAAALVLAVCFIFLVRPFNVLYERSTLRPKDIIQPRAPPAI